MRAKLFAVLSALALGFSSPAFAARGYGATFGVGTTDSVQTGYTGGLSAQHSISLWYWINGAGGGSLGRAFVVNTSALQANSGTGTLLYGMPFSTTNGSWNFSTVSTGRWHSLVLTYDGSSVSNKPTVYIDGSVVSVSTQTTPVGTFVTNSGNALYIGNAASANRNWDGKLAEFALWNGQILSASEALAISRGVPPLLIRPSALIMYSPLLGVAAGESDWGASHYSQTVVGTGKQPHPPMPYFNNLFQSQR